MAFIQERIAELKARIAEGGAARSGDPQPALHRHGGTGGGRARVQHSCVRCVPKHGGLTLEEFKRMLREQFFALMLDPDGALAAIPKMLPDDTDARTKALAAIRAVVSATGEVSGERAERLARIEAMLGEPAPASRPEA